MKLLLLVIVVCSLKNVSAIQGQDKHDRNRTTPNQDDYFGDFYKRNKWNSGLENNKENSLIGTNFRVKVKRSATDVTKTGGTSTTKLGVAVHETTTTKPERIINFNKDTLPKCPDKFTYYTDILGNSVCYFITKPTPFPPPCPYPTAMEYFYISLQMQVTDQEHWAFTHRNVSSIGRKNCLLRKSDMIDLIPTSCKEKYPGICVYNSNFTTDAQSIPTFSDYCRKRYNDSCISDDFSSVPRCYCKSESPRKQLRGRFCKNLVEIKEAYINNAILKLLSGNESCWIGLEKEATTLSSSNETVIPYKWTRTNTKSKYTFWSNSVDIDKIYGAVGRDGWVLEEDGSLNCAICEMEDEDHAQVHLHITHNKTSHLLQVHIQNPIEVFQNVTCFTPDSEDFRVIDLRSIKERLVITELEFPFMSSGYYWCEALQIANLTPVYSNTIFLPRTYGNEYALIITFPEEADEAAAYLPRAPSTVACDSIREQFRNYVHTSIPIKIVSYNEKEGTLEILCHITTSSYKLPISDEFKIVSDLLNNSTAKITNLANIEVCISETTTSEDYILQWPETRIGVTTIPEQLCLQKDGSPVTRTCSGNFYYGSQWLNVSGTCADITLSEQTKLLFQSNTTTSNDLSTTLLDITCELHNFTSFEIYLISKSLEELSESEESLNVTSITRTVNNIMYFDRNELRDSQKILNSTDTILYSFDEILSQTELDESGYMSEVTEKLVVQITDLTKTEINGIKVEKTHGGFTSTNVESLHRGTSKEDILEKNLELAVLLSPQLRNDIVSCMGTGASPNLITTVFYDDALFVEQQSMPRHPNGRIISVSIPNFDCPFTAPLQVIYNTAGDVDQLKCASWNYGLNGFMESIQGQWFIEGDPKSFGNSTFQICEFKHITHFALLILGDFDDDISVKVEKVLDVTTAVGTFISVLGLIMIFLTAIMFRTYHSPGTVILLNFSIAITAKIVLLFVADNLGDSEVLCTVFGAALHYVVLAQFCWMLTIAMFQYRRYVIVFENTASQLVIKACAFSWGIPFIPVIIILLISKDNYGKNTHGLCYALGNYFIFGVLAPVSVVLLLNLTIFIAIIIGITSPRPDRVHQKRDETFSLQLKLGILLYFALGFTWIFGLLASLDGGNTFFSFLFCLTATLQGFVLFLYFIVLNEKTRNLWMTSKCCCCKLFKKESNPDTAAQALGANSRNPQHLDINFDHAKNKLLDWEDHDEDDRL